MIYSYAITIPANTSEADPVEQEIRLTAGLISHVEVEFPAGCAGLVHLRVMREGGHLWPTNPEGNLASDDYVIPWDEHIELTSSPYRLQAVAWSDDDTYSHTLTLRINMLPLEVVERARTTQSIIGRLGALIFGGR